MAQTLVIDPVTRIEGHAKISIYLDDNGQVTDARFHVVEFRGFEKFCEGRPLWEMAGITARICGICPVSHLIASVKAGDNILAVRISPAAEKLRRLMNLGQIVQSHALSFFHLSSPDFVLGYDAEPLERNVFGLIAADPELARAGIRLRQFGQDIISMLGGKKIHPAWTVPGGVRSSLAEEDRQNIRERLPEARATVQVALDLLKKHLDENTQEPQVCGNFASLFMGLVGKNGNWEHYDGHLRFTDSMGNAIADHIDPSDYAEYIGEAVEPWSYLKFPYYKPMGYPQGMYRVGPLARINICDQIGTEWADAELREFRDRNHGAASSSFQYHYARLVEIVAALEKIALLVDDPDITSDRLRADAGINQLEGVGVSEAPRGTLIHHYWVDEDGILQKVNLIIATGHNNLAMNRTVAQIAKHFITGPKVPEGLLNRVEAGIRAYDPCLSCSTHAVGRMPMHLELRDSSGAVVDEAWK
jgi:NAD-reducing hydrogenase large subunit